MIPTLIFFAFILFYFYLGFIFWQNRNIKKFFAWTVLLPLTPALIPLHTKYQIIVYYAFIALPLIFFLSNEFNRLRLRKNTFFSTLILLPFFIFYLILGYFLNTNGLDVINILKDTKPIVFLAVGFIFLDILKGSQIDWNGKFCKKLLFWNFLATLFFFLVLNKTSLVSVATNDPYYLQSSVRYVSMGSFFAILYLLAKMSSNTRIKIRELVFILTPIFLSGNRTFILILVLLFGLNTLMAMTNPKSFIKKAALLFFGLIALAFGVLSLNEALKERVVSLLNVELLLTELAEKRFLPFFIKLDSFSWYNYIFGKGIGETFFIPWFEYRENIDNFNVYMDNIYLTLYVKYGLGMFILLFCLVYFINKTKTNKRFKILVIAYFVIIGLTTSFIYQSSFLFILLLLAGTKISETIPKISEG